MAHAHSSGKFAARGGDPACEARRKYTLNYVIIVRVLWSAPTLAVMLMALNPATRGLNITTVGSRTHTTVLPAGAEVRLLDSFGDQFVQRARRLLKKVIGTREG